MTKTPAQRATPSASTAKKPVSAAKTAVKTAVKPAAKAPAKAAAAPKAPAAKAPAAKPAAKAVHAPVAAPAKPVAKAVEVAAPKPVAVKPPPAPKLSAAARASAAASSPAPIPPATSRFADRFAPPRPPTRQMNSLVTDISKHEHKADPKLANAWKNKPGEALTDDELQAMPDSEYMNEKQLAFFKARLQQLKDDLLSNAGETTEHLREDTSIVPDPADRATIEEEHALELRTRDRERKLLKKISQSLGRIEAGDYGFCDETGEPIGLGRLIARPTATLSLEAQQRRELKQKMFGD